MLKEAGGVVGGVLLFSPIGMPILLHGVAGAVVGGAGLFVADAVLKQVTGAVSNLIPHSEPTVSVEGKGDE
ncbi:MAG: hypothetical protein WBP54_02170 [Pelodictyon phaeoclathratiforme]